MVAYAPQLMRGFGLGYDNALWSQRNNPPNDVGWTGWGQVTPGRQFVYDPVSVSRIQNEASAFVVDCNGHSLQQLDFKGDAPQPIRDLGGCLTGPPALASSKGGLVHIFHIGTDRGLYYKSWNGTAYTPGQAEYQKLEGTFRDVPAAVSAGEGEVSCFAIGQLDGCLYHQKWTQKGGWEKLEKLSGLWSGSLSAVSDQEGNWDVFGLDLNGKINRVSNRKGQATFSTVTSGPFLTVDAVCCNPGCFDLVTTGLNNSVYHRRCTNGSWTGWQDLRLSVAHRPTPVSHSPGALAVITVDMASITHIRVRDAQYGDWSDAGWISIGGMICARVV
ncbi:hypothetical protein M422DRAFT_48119 [Sphaerobolus stellatus SS14]|uniref:PLL-like beta propeller domain-containing protein n=1 Tax=Sphaerobolus stellatus (strain SS14) TaxID=990650 RepID=A0A0C9V6U2_SPHS4|nr:hypothetical protein M422DRAFT_48119 [Sphaerobolus stellatus SS14]